VSGISPTRRAQPLLARDRHGLYFFGLLLLSVAITTGIILIAAALVGLDRGVSSESGADRAACLGAAVSALRIGVSARRQLWHSMGGLDGACIVVPFGQPSIAWFSLIALCGDRDGLWGSAVWYRTARYQARDPSRWSLSRSSRIRGAS